MSRPALIAGWICRIAAAAILLQTLYFKFTAAPESVYLFTPLGTEPADGGPGGGWRCD